jgi:molybdopterin synthase sulfur carrier subunit
VAVVHLSSDLSPYADGLTEVEVAGARVVDIFLALSRRFPGLAGRLAHMAVAIDGEMYQDADYRPVRPDSEIHLVPPIQGG